MIKRFLKVLLISSFITASLFSASGIRFNVVNGDAEYIYNDIINTKLESTGFMLSDPHERINDAYKIKYGSKFLEDSKVNPDYDVNWKENLDNLGFFSITNDIKLRELLLSNPELGGFSPFNLHIYKTKKENKSYVGHLVPSVMLDIVGIKDKETRTKFETMFFGLDDLIQKEIGGNVEITQYATLPTKPMMNFEIKFNRPKELSEYIDEFQENFEAAFEDNDYIIAGYKNFRESYSDLELKFEKYDAYFVYSLCHFKYSYNIFNKGRPDAGAFAPCSMYMYIEKNSNKLIIGMPKLSNWSAVMNIKDDIINKSINDLDAEIIEIMKSLGAKEI